MASFISETLSWTGALMRQFDTFAEFRNVVVYKEPLEQILNSGISVMAGYESEVGGQEGSTFIPVSGVFPCVMVGKSAKDRTYTDFRAEVNTNMVRIKVKENARNFINSGKNLYFELDGKAYDQSSNEEVQNFLGLKFYIFSLTETT